MPTLSKRTTKQRRKALGAKKRKATRTRKANLAAGRNAQKAKAREHRRGVKALKPTVRVAEPVKVRAGRVTIDEAMKFVAATGGVLSPTVTQAENEERGLLHCPGCREMRPAEDFLGVELSLDPQAPPPCCRLCREKGLPVVRGEPGIDPRAAYVIQRRASGASYAAIAAEVGLSAHQVRAIASGEVLEGQGARRAFAIALRNAGIDPVALARKGAELLSAKKALVHMGVPTGYELEDNTTQSAVWRHLTKLADLEPPKQKVVQSRSIKVTTNFDEPHPEDRSGEITIRQRVEQSA